MILILAPLALPVENQTPTLPYEVEFCQQVAPYDLAGCVEALQYQEGRYGMFSCKLQFPDGNPKVICYDTRSPRKGGTQEAPD